MAGPDVSFVLTRACNLEVPGLNPSRAGYLSSWLCIYSAQNCSNACIYSAVCGTVYYKEPLKSFEIRVGHSPGFGLPSVAIFPHCVESDVKQYSLTHSHSALFAYLYMLWVYVHYICFFSVGIDFRRRILTSKVDSHTERARYL